MTRIVSWAGLALALAIVPLCSGPADGQESDTVRYGRSTEVLKPPNSGFAWARYAKAVPKQDIVRVGDTVVIDDILKSYGGDIVIFANDLVINAPLDTRVYFDHGAADLDPADYVWNPTHNKYECLSSARWWADVKTIADSHSAYYSLTEDWWDNVSKEYRLNFVNGQTIPVKEFPELPHGATQCAPHPKYNDHSGTITINESSVRLQDLRSGTITIFAHRITFCQQCEKLPEGWNGVKDLYPECRKPPAPIRDTTFLNARGIRGSRGSLGVWGCHVNDPHCPIKGLPTDPDWGVAKGPRGYSPGGDGGEIRVFFVNNEAASLQENDKALPFSAKEILPRSGISAGDQTAREYLHVHCWTRALAPSGPCRRPPSSGTRCEFVAAGVPLPAYSTFIQPKDGIGPTVEAVDSDTALVLLAGVLNALERGADFKGLIAQATNGFVRNVTPVEQLEGYLLSSLRKAAQNLAKQAIDLDPSNLGSPVLPPVLSTVTGDLVRYIGLSTAAAGLVRSLSYYVPTPNNGPLRSFLAARGGLLVEAVAAPDAELKHAELSQKLQDIDAVLQKILKANLDLHFDVFTMIIVPKYEAEFQSKIAALEQAIDNAIKEASNQAKFGKIKPLLDSAWQAVKAFGEAYATGSFVGAMQQFIKIGENLTKAYTVWNDPTDIISLIKLLASVKAEYEAFLRFTQEKKLELVKAKDQALDQLLADSEFYNQNIIRSLSLFDDFLRLAVLTRINSFGPNAPGDFVAYLASLEEFAAHFPTKAPHLSQHGTFQQECTQANTVKLSDAIGTSGSPACVSIDAQTNTTTLQTKDWGIFSNLPLYVIDAGGSSNGVPLYRLIDGNHLERVPSGEAKSSGH